MNNGNDIKETATPELDKMLKENCGYLLFAAVLTKRRDPIGNNIIDYLYQRRRLTLEDAGNASKELLKFVQADISKLIAIDDGERY